MHCVSLWRHPVGVGELRERTLDIAVDLLESVVKEDSHDQHATHSLRAPTSVSATRLAAWMAAELSPWMAAELGPWMAAELSP